MFTVQKSFYALTSTRGRIAVAQAALESARTVQEAAEERLTRGLATLPEASLARQQAVQAVFDLEEILARERDAQVTLAQSLGIPPTTPIQVADFSTVPLPTALEESVGFCREFHLEAFWGMISLSDPACSRERGSGDGQLQGRPFREGHHPDLRPVVCGVQPL